MLYEVLKTAKLGASFAPDMYTALWAQKLARDGEVKTLSGAPPLSFKANGQPLLDYLISGNTVQNGTPTPDNPIMPEGCGERTGNLFDGDYQKAILSISGSLVTYYTNSRGRVAVIPCSPSTQYTAKKYGETNRFIIAESETKPSGGDTLSLINNNSELVEYTFTTGANTHYVAIYVSTSSEQAEPPLMLNTGSTALPYEPYGYKIPISSASTTTPVYLGEVQTTRNIKKLVFDGSEPWILSGNIVYINNTDTMKLSPLICTHFPNVQNTGMWNGNNWVFQVDISNLGMSGRDAWITYLQQQYAAGTPVTVWYVLAESEIAAVNEPLMKIGDYADTVSKAQTGVEIPTARGTNTLDVLTDVKPSEIYIKYKS